MEFQAFVIEYRTTAPIFCRLNNLLVRYAKKEFIPPFFRKPQLQKGPFLLFLLVIQDIHTPYREWMLKLGCIDIGLRCISYNFFFKHQPEIAAQRMTFLFDRYTACMTYWHVALPYVIKMYLDLPCYMNISPLNLYELNAFVACWRSKQHHVQWGACSQDVKENP